MGPLPEMPTGVRRPRLASMHPIERLRYVARSHGGDQRLLVRETAGALRGLGLDPAGIVVACRRIVERHPTSGALWWLCSSVVTAASPFETASRLADRIEDDPTPEVLIDSLAPDAVVTVLGWPDLAGEALIRRGDASVLTVDIAGEGMAFARRLERNDIDVEVVDPAGLGAAVLASDVVLIEALACTASRVLAVQGSLAVASVAYAAEIPVWLVAGRGRCLPEQVFDVVGERAVDAADVPWRAEAEALPIELCSDVIRDVERLDRAQAASSLTPECPVAHELLRPSPM